MCDNNIIPILDVLLTETTLVTKVESWTGSKLGPLPSRSQFRSNPGLVETWTTTPPWHPTQAPIYTAWWIECPTLAGSSDGPYAWKRWTSWPRPDHIPTFAICGLALKLTDTFTYIGSAISSSVSLEVERSSHSKTEQMGERKYQVRCLPHIRQMTPGEPSGRRELHQFKSVPSFSVANVVETAIPELDYKKLQSLQKCTPWLFRCYAIVSRDARMPTYLI